MKRSSKTVPSKSFPESDFFKPHDQDQVKYEMLRAHCHEGHFITKVCKELGYSRESFCQALGTFHGEGLAGLTDKPEGKNKA